MKESHPLQGQPLKGTVQDQGIAVQQQAMVPQAIFEATIVLVLQGIAVQQAMVSQARTEATIVLVLQVLVAMLEVARAMLSMTQV